MLENKQPTEHVANCCICKGPINAGEPVLIYESGYAHRFRITCENYLEDIKKYDTLFLRGCGVILDEKLND